MNNKLTGKKPTQSIFHDLEMDFFKIRVDKFSKVWEACKPSFDTGEDSVKFGKIVVWGTGNKEVDSCATCPCLNHLDMDGSPYCNMLQEDIRDSNDVHKDCPFNKTVTGEDFEKHGFVELKHSNEYLLKFKQDNFFIMYSPHNKHCVIEKGIINEMSTLPESLLVFKGDVTNPIELEFILNSVGVIEGK